MSKHVSLLASMTNLVKVAYELRKQMDLKLVAQSLGVTINDLLELEGLGYIEVKVGYAKPTTFRVTAEAYKATNQ